LWPSRSKREVPWPWDMVKGKGGVCSNVRVLPPGRELVARSCWALERGLLEAKRASAAARAACAAAWLSAAAILEELIAVVDFLQVGEELDVLLIENGFGHGRHGNPSPAPGTPAYRNARPRRTHMPAEARSSGYLRSYLLLPPNEEMRNAPSRRHSTVKIIANNLSEDHEDSR